MSESAGGFARWLEVFQLGLRREWRRPLLLALVALMALIAWGLSTGQALLTTGSDRVGGTRALLSSQFSLSQLFAIMVPVLYPLFVGIAAGLSTVRDAEVGIDELLASTPLTAAERVWGRFSALLASFLLALLAHAAALVFFFHGPSSVGRESYLGAFSWSHYLVPLAVFAVPAIVFTAGLGYAVGHFSRRPAAVFALPVVQSTTIFFLFWNFKPTWLDPALDRMLMWLDPSGYRWLDRTWLEVDRGVDFYNTTSVGFDAPFLLSRLAFVAIGLAAVASCHGRWRRRGVLRPDAADRSLATASAAAQNRGGLAWGVTSAGVEALGRRRPLSWLEAAWRVGRVELRELRSSPALYLFAPLVVGEAILNAVFVLGPFQTPVLLTARFLAGFEIPFFTVMLTPLLLFYAVEALERERRAGFAEILTATPLPTSAIFAGKLGGLAALTALILAFAAGANLILLAVQGETPLDASPFLAIWGTLLMPTLLVWVAFVLALWALSGSRALTWGLALGALVYTFYKLFRGEVSWVGNWLLWGTPRWSDMAPLELDLRPLVLNRLFVLSLALFFLALAVRTFARRQRDAQRIMSSLRPATALPAVLRLAPFAVLPLALGGVLWSDVEHGFEGPRAEERAFDYWRANLDTWKDRPLPSLARMDLDVELEPAESRLRMDGRFTLHNPHPEPLAELPFTVGLGWRDLAWSVDGEPQASEDRAGLHVLRPAVPLAPGATVVVGFSYAARQPDGASRGGGAADSFILPGGTALDDLVFLVSGGGPTFLPHIGYVEGLGVSDENRYERATAADDLHTTVVPPALGGTRPFDLRMRVRGPAEYTYNSVGVKVSDEVADGRRTVVWESDHPVRMVNLLAGRWAVAQGEVSKVFYHPEHPYNIDEIVATLDAARHHYSEWFAPYPWRELKLSEVPNLSAWIGGTGFATNISFSEGVGFLARNDHRTDATFLVTAHEAAHQWWGNILTPGDGPGGLLLAEGMAHYSTLLLFAEVRGDEARRAFARRIEESYVRGRRVDHERPLARLDLSRPGDTTAAYNKGGWVFWMLHDLLGEEASLAGIQAFIEAWKDGPDHPLLEDFLAAMRPFAGDAEAFDRFAEQWFFDVVLPDYHLGGARRELQASGDWRVRAELANRGSGTMPVEVAAFDAAGSRAVRHTVILEPGARRQLELTVPFAPTRLVVDPDVRVLQSDRAAAVAQF